MFILAESSTWPIPGPLRPLLHPSSSLNIDVTSRSSSAVLRIQVGTLHSRIRLLFSASLDRLEL